LVIEYCLAYCPARPREFDHWNLPFGHELKAEWEFNKSMPIVNLISLAKSFKYAFKGLWYVVKTEQSFRIHVIASLIVIILMIYFQVSLWQAIILLLVITLVLILELINSIFEKIIDILKPRVHFYVQIIKDMMAAAVLIASVGALVVGIMIFAPYFF
jgi:diacylglycerol kinase